MRYLSAMDSTISAVFTIRSILRVACYFLSSLGSMSNLTPSRIFLRMNKSSLSLILTSISNKYMEPSKQRKCQISTLLPTWKGLRLSTTISTTTKSVIDLLTNSSLFKISVNYLFEETILISKLQEMEFNYYVIYILDDIELKKIRVILSFD